MLSKIVIGTANFNKSYGILSNGQALSRNEIEKIVKTALENKIRIFDTAFSYGNLLEVLPAQYIEDLKIITKFSVLDDYDHLLKKIKRQNKHSNFSGYESILIHDPHCLKDINKNKLKNFLQHLKNEFNLGIGLSIYDLSELKEFESIYTPDLIQIPFNPLNQKFSSEYFLNYIQSYKIKVHARSLFLQGILLKEELPLFLEPLQSHWTKFLEKSVHFSSTLQCLLAWAQTHEWVDHWVLGLSSVKDLIDIVNESTIADFNNKMKLFEGFEGSDHPLVDPRHWKNI